MDYATIILQFNVQNPMMLSESSRDWKRRRLWRIPFKRVPKVQGRKAESLRQKDRAGSMIFLVCLHRSISGAAGILPAAFSFY